MPSFLSFFFFFFFFLCDFFPGVSSKAAKSSMDTGTVGGNATPYDLTGGSETEVIERGLPHLHTVCKHKNIKLNNFELKENKSRYAERGWT